MFQDVTEEVQAERQIRYLTFHDKLTGLYNRTYFEERLPHFDVEESLPVSVIVGDVNELKLVNDAFGREEGDRLLKKMVQILQNSCRKEDIIPFRDRLRNRRICQAS